MYKYHNTFAREKRAKKAKKCKNKQISVAWPEDHQNRLRSVDREEIERSARLGLNQKVCIPADIANIRSTIEAFDWPTFERLIANIHREMKILCGFMGVTWPILGI
jgi:hypothetical protein